MLWAFLDIQNLNKSAQNDSTAHNEGAASENGTTWVYDYDRGGSILSKAAFAYTTGTVDATVRTWLYEYNDTNWKDKLTKFDGHTITYDALGNPLSDGTWMYTWQAGRQLKSTRISRKRPFGKRL